MKKKKRLLWQLYPSYLLITLISLVAVTIYAGSSFREFYLDRIAGDLRARAYLLEKQILQFLGPLDTKVVDALCKELGKPSTTRITVILPSGTVIGDSHDDPDRMDNHALRPEVIQAKKGNVGRSIRFSITLQQRMMYVAVPLTDHKRIVAVIRTSLPVTPIDEKLMSIQTQIAFGGLLIAFVAAGISLYVSRRISRPIEKMKEGAEHFARGDLSHRLPETELQEIGSLADALNQMAVQLDDRIKMIINQRNELEAVLSSMEEGVIAFDKDERIISINQAAARIFEKTPKHMLNRSIQEVIRNSELQQFVNQALSSTDNLEGDITLYHEGERIIYLHSTSLRDSNEDQIGVLVVMNDVTQMRRLENIRRDFAANVSHEIKTPLTAIKGFVETLRHGSVKNPEEIKRFLSIIEKHVNRLTEILEDLISLSRIEQDDEKKAIKLRKNSIKNVLQTAIGNCREIADLKNITIDCVCEENLSAMIDPTLLEQAVANLLDNAINYSHEGSSVHVSSVQKQDSIIIRVQDHGTGISKEHLTRLFERFYRADKARSRDLGGTGLGLAIVKHITQAHGGYATVESTFGKGSTFSLHLPAE
ncbi:MAG: PAS domain-containing sensor histidine kinase [Deltaproteobacteria bacterium]|nr:MAG: PAS domain-containing sensor histidine kinase [Deltaproteobacteria bacterium]